MKKLRLLLLAFSVAAFPLLSGLPALAADYTVTAASVASSVQGSFETAGAAITPGQPLYKGTDAKVYLFTATGAAPANRYYGMSINGASASGQPVAVITGKDASFTPGFTLAAGAIVIGSATAGKLAPGGDAASGMTIVVVGVGTGSNKMTLSPVQGGAVP